MAVSSPVRRIDSLMALRTLLVTLLLGVILLGEVLSGTHQGLVSLHSQILFGTVVAAYFSTLAYAFGHHLIRHKERFFAVVLAMDALLISLAVHVTGGIDSAWTFLYLLLPVEAAIAGYRRWALWTTVGVCGLFLLTTLAGYSGHLLPVEGQRILPNRVPKEELASMLLVNLAAQVAIAVLATSLAEQLRSASAREEVAQESLREMEQLNGQILESLSSGLVTLDRQGLVLMNNSAARELLGETLARGAPFDPSDVLVTTPALLAAEDGELVPQRLRGQLSRKDAASEPVPVELTVTWLRDEGGARTGSILLFQDLREVAEMEAQLRRAERMAAVGKLAAGIAHEIRNPLAAVSGSLELLCGSVEASEEDLRLLRIALREVERLNSLVTSLLGYARPRTPQIQRFDLVELVREVVSMGGQGPDLRVMQVELTLPETSCYVEADPDQLRQVIWNLIRNAAEAAGPGGQISLSLDTRGEPGQDLIRLRIADDGPGWSAEALEHLFEPLFTTKDRGTGLGLATVQRIVEEHGGQVEVGNHLSGGAWVEILLPTGAQQPGTTETV